MDLGVWRLGRPLRPVRCWQCGVEAEGANLVEGVGLVPYWLSTDHEHAELPPTPEQLQAAGAAALARIQDGG